MILCKIKIEIYLQNVTINFQNFGGNMKNNKKLLFSILFFILMIVVTCFLLFKDNEIGDIISVAKGVNVSFLAICLGLVIVYLVIEALYIHISFKSLNQKTKLTKCFSYSCIEYYFSAITPSSTGGQPFQSYYMAKDGIPVTKSSIVLLLNTITFKMILLLLGIVCIIFKSSLIFSNGILFNILFIIGFLINFTIIVLCFLVMKSKNKIKKMAIWLINLLSNLHLKKDPENAIQKMDGYMEEYKKGVYYLKKHPLLTLKVLGLTLIQRLAMFSIGYVVYLAFGLNGFSYFDFLTIQIIIAIAIDSLPFPGGVGITEAMLIKIYSGIYGAELLTAAVLLTRLFSYYSCLILSGIVSLVNHVKVIFKGRTIKKEET